MVKYLRIILTGVGKTSVASSIATALNRKFARISLSGFQSDYTSELKGHHYTYTAAKPGQFVKVLRQTGVMNPVILLDEIDKIGVAEGSTLLEALDPVQNKGFTDKYVGDMVDLSQCLFIVSSARVFVKDFNGFMLG